MFADTIFFFLTRSQYWQPNLQHQKMTKKQKWKQQKRPNPQKSHESYSTDY